MTEHTRPWPQVPVSNKNHTQAAVVIIGAGMSGMCTAIDLLKQNKCKNFIILEKSGGLGGTWRDNKYPGCCCDVFSHLYSYSFEQNPDWTREYPGQEEILSYLVGIGQKYNLFEHIRFNSTVDAANWDDASKTWKVEVSVQNSKEAEYGSNYTISADYLVSAVGQLNMPKIPELPGIDEFRGKLMHSARWDWSYDLQGKRVAIIGNGPTAAQIIPEIAPQVGHLTIHQRTPNWIIPRLDAPIPEWKRAMYRYIPLIRWRKRAEFMDFREAFWDAVFNDQSALSQWLQQTSKDLLRSQLETRPDLWPKLQPNYKIGCKRVVISDDYFPVYLRDNVSLETGHIDKITEKGIVTDGKEEDYDLIIFATGFKTVEFLTPMKITGSAGRELNDVWRDGGEALYGVTVDSMPNFAMLYGPNTNLGHNSIVLMIEAQSRYINGMIGEILKERMNGGTLVLQPRSESLKDYNNQLQEELAKSSFADEKCGSWYKLANGKITNNWSKNVIDYQKLLSNIDWSDYDMSGTGAERLKEGTITKLGRVVEETVVSYQAMGMGLVSVAAIGAFAFLRSSGRLRLG